MNAGANVIQIFDSWSGLISQDKLIDYCFKPNLKLVNFCKKLGVPVVYFPKGIKKEMSSIADSHCVKNNIANSELMEIKSSVHEKRTENHETRARFSRHVE